MKHLFEWRKKRKNWYLTDRIKNILKLDTYKTLSFNLDLACVP
jgi:hypothetical protein